MVEQKRSDVFISNFRNPTKLGIVLLLMQKGPMTVTQMSKTLQTTRSNLYQAVAELVSDGFLREPSVKVKKGYVEKYYSINEAAFDSISQSEVDLSLGSQDINNLREVLFSFLKSQSFLLNLIAEEVLSSDDSYMKNVQEMIRKNFYIASFSKLSDVSFNLAVSKLQGLMKSLTEVETPAPLEKSNNMLLLIGIPSVDFLNFNSAKDTLVNQRRRK
ncbi:MAG: winged helix-turn-helix domain-containing protein [Thermoplasmatales archaeon]|nr:winged helix-turn-helix domain-containing protein [Thermoplasmatales archaeon]MCW6171021.1 winged helix-turn-helix domain-containing protein [Thermoplasmatales archaeon]